VSPNDLAGWLPAIAITGLVILLALFAISEHARRATKQLERIADHLEGKQ